MENFICVQCGTQFDETAEPPPSCPICEDERQFVRHAGQEWTTLAGYRLIIKTGWKRKRRSYWALAQNRDLR